MSRYIKNYVCIKSKMYYNLEWREYIRPGCIHIYIYIYIFICGNTTIYITSNYVSMKTAHAIGAMVCLDDMVFENYSMFCGFINQRDTKFWFRKKDVTSGVSKTPKD